MPYFEAVTLLNGRLTRKELIQCMKDTVGEIRNAGALITRIDPLGADGMGPRKLAAHLRKHQINHYFGYYVQIGFFGNHSMLKQIERKYRFEDRILRFIFVKGRRLTDCMKPAYVLDEPLPHPEPDKGDAIYELRRFMNEYEREFPSGESIDIAARLRRANVSTPPALRNIGLSGSYKPSTPRGTPTPGGLASKYLKMLGYKVEETGPESEGLKDEQEEKEEQKVDEKLEGQATSSEKLGVTGIKTEELDSEKMIGSAEAEVEAKRSVESEVEAKGGVDPQTKEDVDPQTKEGSNGRKDP